MKSVSALALSLSVTALAAPPSLTGLYRVGNAGYVEFAAQGERLVGSSRGSLACPSKPGDQLVVGTLQGSAFIGEILLCQEGPACDAEKSYPFLGVLKDDTIVGTVKLETSCTSQGLETQTLVIRPATAAEKNSGLTGAAGRGLSKKETDELAALLKTGKTRLEAGNFAGARDAFALIVRKSPDNALALSALGVAQMQLKKYRDAFESFQAATPLFKDSPKEQADNFYNLACAQARLGKKKDAVISLRQAVTLGGPRVYVDSIAHEADLESLRSDRDFKAFMQQTVAAAKKSP